jgi:CHAT domain-containing protein
MNCIFILIPLITLSACSTALAVADIAGTTVVYGVKTVVKTIDAVTPDVINKE